MGIVIKMGHNAELGYFNDRKTKQIDDIKSNFNIPLETLSCEADDLLKGSSIKKNERFRGGFASSFEDAHIVSLLIGGLS